MATGRDGQTAGVKGRAIAIARTYRAPCATRALSRMGDRSKAEARKAETSRKFEEGKRETRPLEVRCRGCRKSHREVKAMVEMGGFVFCDECIELAASIIAVRKAGSR